MSRKSQAEPLLIVILSGATGRTVHEVVTSALAQFEQANVKVVKQTNVRSISAARRAVRGISRDHAVILHSLVSPRVRDAVLDEAKRRMIPTVDVLGPVIAVLADQLGRSPREKPGLSYALHKEYIDRMDAVSYTLEHDDGAGLATLHLADVVLVGVSRASKSVTCFYLGYRGVRAANVPLILGVDAPEQLLAMPREKVIGLAITPHRLTSVREARRERYGDAGLEQYIDQRTINEELRYAAKLVKKHGWRCIDVSYMAVEEAAAQILQMIGQR